MFTVAKNTMINAIIVFRIGLRAFTFDECLDIFRHNNIYLRIRFDRLKVINLCVWDMGFNLLGLFCFMMVRLSSYLSFPFDASISIWMFSWTCCWKGPSILSPVFVSFWWLLTHLKVVLIGRLLRMSQISLYKSYSGFIVSDALRGMLSLAILSITSLLSM